MKKFFETVKIKFDVELEKYFKNVEVESVKTTRAKDTLNFYLVSKDIIPYDAIKQAEKRIEKELFDGFIDEEKPNRHDIVKIFIRYDIEEGLSAKKIYELIRKDLFKELKDISYTNSVFLRDEYISWTDANTLQIGFDHIDSLKKKQDEIVDFIKYIFKMRFGIDIVINILWLENNYNTENNFYQKKNNIEKFAKNEVKAENQGSDNSKNDNNENTDSNKHKTTHNSKDSKTYGNRKRLINADGDILYGRKNKLKNVKRQILDLLYEMDNVETEGVIFNVKTFMPKNKDFAIYSIFITDNEGAIEVKFFGDKYESALFDSRFKIGTEISVEGKVVNDSWTKAFLITPTAITKIGQRTVIEYGKFGTSDYYNEILTDRKDEEKVKRVELHLHTKLSAQDGIGDVKQYIDTAKRFGMNAMAITDHGCVNALADGYQYIEKDIKEKKFKIINGVEGYLVDDNFIYYYDKYENQIDDNYSFDDEFVTFEIVTTGHNRKNDVIIEILANKIKNKKVIECFSEYVYTDKILSFDVKEKTSIMQSNVKEAKELKEVLEHFAKFIGDAVVVVKNTKSNWKLNETFIENGIENNFKFLDLTTTARLTLGGKTTTELISIAKELNVKIEGITDKKRGEQKKALTPKSELLLMTEVLKKLLAKLSIESKIDNLKNLKDIIDVNSNFIKKQKSYHIILLAKNDVGRVNLYKLVSDSYVKYFYSTPRIPRSLLNKYREGIIVGSACIAGELMQAVKDNLPDEELIDIASFYDYLEIQPVLNNSFLLKQDSENFKTLKDLENLNKKVVELADKLDKLVVATCDCHYVDKGDKIFREILRTGIRNKKTNRDSDGSMKDYESIGLESTSDELLYFRTTKEMLDEFAYLGVDKAYEVVVKNTNLICDMIEYISPIRPDKCPPFIVGSDEELTNACFANLKRIYGENPPKDIEDRLNSELKYIIDNGYSVMYIAAKKLIDYSKENGFSVGSRGSVGSSLAATLSGVSEVNPMRPHYVCPNCHYTEYGTEQTKKYDNDTGFDMPDKICPKCNTKMNKDGVNIPFETFLGIPGDPKAAKEPDIDLNFCSIFQSKIHEKTRDLFGSENTFKAGTVGTVAVQTAYRFVDDFGKIFKLNLTNAQKDYYKSKIIDCKNTTSQHPGGMVVVPEGEKIYTFTPLQIAANKEGNDITTQFDYHKIDKNLLKLDILGHDAPLMLKKLSDLTGVDFNTVPFYEDKVLKLFESTEPLGITPDDISGTRLGCLTIPEFGTDFAMNMCLEAKPKTVADLIRIAGLAHGTNVWQNNVQELIKNGDCTLKTAICCRDDIMIYLKEKGLDHGTAFNIMEYVRKGKGKKLVTEELRNEMRSHGVPEWYIGCCDKIEYMFPKAHAAAYVLASLRIAYYKVHYPKEYYAAYFSIENNKNGFNYKLMMKDKEEIHFQIEKLVKIINERKKSDKGFEEKFNRAERPMDAVEKFYNAKRSDNNDEIELNNEKEVKDVVGEIKSAEDYSRMSAAKLFDLYMCYRHVEEMKARNIDFCPIDIYKAKRSDFVVCGDKIMPSFDSISGLGTKKYEIDFDDNVAEKDKSTAMRCEIEGKKDEYTSIENFAKRTGVHKTQIDEMKEMGIFDCIKDKEEPDLLDYINKLNAGEN